MAKGRGKRYSLRTKMIQYNLLVTIASLLLCGVVFVGSVWAIVGNYIHTDINFFLTAKAEGLEARIDYCKDVIYRIRESQVLMQYLRSNSAGAAQSSGQFQDFTGAFESEISISSQNNQSTGGIPLVEEVYLFDNNGNYIRSAYYAMMYAEIAESSADFEKIYKTYRQERRQEWDYRYYSMGDSYVCLAFPLYDETMTEVGSVLYRISKSAVSQLMQDMENYQDSFWTLCDSKGNYVFGEHTEDYQESAADILTTYHQQPYQAQAGAGQYRLLRKNVGMDLQVILGIPENQALLLLYNSIWIYVLLIVLITVLACVIFILITYRMTRPIKEVTSKLQAVKEGDFSTKLPDYSSEEFHEISNVFNDMTAYVNNLINQVYEKQLSIKDMEMKFLQTQMNPHFMFNVLNTIALQAKMDGNENVYKMIRSFSQLIQAKIYRSDTEKVKVEQELEYVDYYLYLQSYRYGDRLNYSISIENEELTKLYIPKLCIQLIVENAVVHGIEPKTENGVISVRIYEEEDRLVIETRDNGVGFEKEGVISLPIPQEADSTSHNHVGLNNANHIIQLMYGGNYGITVESYHDKGTSVWIRVPFDRENF